MDIARSCLVCGGHSVRDVVCCRAAAVWSFPRAEAFQVPASSLYTGTPKALTNVSIVHVIVYQ
jgi:hypothetical protein